MPSDDNVSTSTGVILLFVCVYFPAALFSRTDSRVFFYLPVHPLSCVPFGLLTNVM